MPSKKTRNVKSNNRWDNLDLGQEGDAPPESPEQVNDTSSELTEIVCVLDRSGSMESMRTQAQNGFNEFLDTQKGIESNIIMTVVLFDHEYSVMHDGVDVHEIEPLTVRTYVPRGSTALYDAVGRTVNTVRERIARASTVAPTRVLFVILTDGHENASEEFRKSDIIGLIDEQKATGWEFIFLGADPSGFDADVVASIGVRNIMAYAPTGAGMHAAYSSISRAAMNYATSGNIGEWADPDAGGVSITTSGGKRKLRMPKYYSKSH